MVSWKLHIKETLNLAYPVIIGQLGFIMMGVVDTIMVGGLGAVSLAAASVANSLFILILIIGIGISYAVTPLVSIAVGANKLDDCGIIFRNSYLVNFITAIILLIFTFFGSFLIQFLNQPLLVVGKASSYTKILGVSILPAMLFQTYKQFLEGLSIVKPAMIVTIAANLINGFGNWILIYGKLGMPAMGLDGAGWATFLSRLFMGIILLYYVSGNKRFLKYDISFHFQDIKKSIIKKILNIGIPSAFQYVFEVGAFSFAVIMVGWLGTKQLAAHQIAINLASISFMATLGISSAGSIRVGNAVGRQDVNEVRRSGFIAVFLGASFMASCGVIFILFRHFLPSLYINDPVVISIAANLLLIAAVFQISDGIQAVGIGILRGLTDVKAPTIITFIAYWVLALPIGYFLGFELNMQVIGVWIGLLIGLSASATMLTLRFNRKSKSLIKV